MTNTVSSCAILCGLWAAEYAPAPGWFLIILGLLSGFALMGLAQRQFGRE